MSELLDKLPIVGTLEKLGIAVDVTDGSVPLGRLVTPPGGLIRPVDPDRVDEYATALQAGAVFPPLLVERIDGSDDLGVIGGWHRRTAAEQADLECWPCGLIVVGPLSEVERLLVAAADNATHGLAMSKEARIEISLRLRAAGVSIEDRITATGLSLQQTTIADGAADCVPRADRLGVPQVAAVPPVAQFRLNTIGDDDLFELACVAVCKNRPSTNQTQEMVGEIKQLVDRDGGTVDEAKAVIFRHVADWSITNAEGVRRGRKRQTSYQRVTAACSGLGQVQPGQVILPGLSELQRRQLAHALEHAGQVIAATIEQVNAGRG